MKRIKIFPIATCSLLAISTIAPAISSCACNQQKYSKVVPNDYFRIVDNTLKGFNQGVDLSKYDTIVIPSNVRIIEQSAFADPSIDYSSIRSLVVKKNVQRIEDYAFAKLQDLDIIDFSDFDYEAAHYIECGKSLFGVHNKYTYIYIKLSDGDELTELAREVLIQKLLDAGAKPEWFIKPTEGHLTLKTAKEKENDGVTQITDKLELVNLPLTNNSFTVSLQKTGGTKNVNVVLNNFSNEKHEMTINASMTVENNYQLKDGDHVIYKAVITYRYANNTQWVQIIDNLKLTYRGDGNIKVTGITLNKSNEEVGIGDKFELYHEITPLTASNKKVTWKSSDESKAKVVDGVVTTYAPGEVTITVTTDDGGFKASCNLYVLEELTGFLFDPNYDEITGKQTSWTVYPNRETVPMDVIIPSKKDGLPVTAIGDEDPKIDPISYETLFISFQGLDITSLTIPSTIEYIGENSFASCKKLSTIAFANNSKLKTIQAGAFGSCESLEEIDLPNSTLEVYSDSFEGTKITTTTYENVNYLKSGNNNYYVALNYNNFSMENPYPEAIDLKFHKDCKLISGKFNKVVHSLTPSDKKCALFPIKTIDFNQSEIRGIGKNAFSYYFSKGFTNPGYYRADDGFTSNHHSCKFLFDNLVLPNSIKFIGDHCFAYQGLKTITLNNDLEYIGESAFSGNNIESIIIPKSVKRIGIIDNKYYKGRPAKKPGMRWSEKACQGTFSNNPLKSVVFEDNSKLQIIGSFTFFNTCLSNITIPNSVETIGSSAFALKNDYSFENFTIPKNVQNLSWIFGGSCENYIELCDSDASYTNKLLNTTVNNLIFEYLGEWTLTNNSDGDSFTFNPALSGLGEIMNFLAPTKSGPFYNWTKNN